MSDFNKAVELILKNEGGFVDDPDDMGGATKYGISLRFLRSMGALGDIDGDGNLDRRDIEGLSLVTARSIYQREWWDKFGYGDITDTSIASKILDMSVNMGPHTAHKLVQKAINLNTDSPLEEDGVLGAKTIQAINSINKERFLKRLKAIVCEYYLSIVRKNETQKKFIDGWLNRGLN